MVDDEFKKLVLSDDELVNNIIIAMFFNYVRDENNGDKEFTLNEYEFYNWYLNQEDNENAKDIKHTLTDLIKNNLNDNIINDIYNTYKDLSINEGKILISSLSHLFYTQNKYKDDEIGQELDAKIKEFKAYIEDYKDEDAQVTDEYVNTLTSNELQEFNKKLKASILSHIIPSINYDIYASVKEHKPFMSLWIKEIKKEELKGFLTTFINNSISDANTYNDYFTLISGYIADTISNKQFSDFLEAYNIDIQAIKDKYPKNDPHDDKKLKNFVSIKQKLNDKEEKDEELDELFNDPLINEVFNKYLEYQKQQAYINLEDNETDIKTWRKKYDEFIEYLENTPQAKIDEFNILVTLKHLSFNSTQIKAYNPKIANNTIKKPTTKELKEKYKDDVLIKGQINNSDYKLKWARVDTSKITTNVINLRETIAKKVETNTDITTRKIKEIESIKKPTKNDLNKLDELKALLKEQQANNENIQKEITDLKDDLALINKQIEETLDAKQVKSLNSKRRKIEKIIKDKEKILKDNGLSFQMDLFSNKYVYEKKNNRTKENYKLMINADYDIQNFNSEGRNFLHYIPNIDNVIDQLDDDFITIDMSDYLDFTGRPTGNITRLRRNLLNTLIEMRKESYEYSYRDEKGALQEGSLVLIGDVKSTEYKGKATVKVQLGATFKENIKNAFINNQIASVKKDTFKLGQGKNKKVELMARELYVYFVKLARIDAKKGLNNGQWRKLLHLDTLITYLAEINLIKYNPNDYNHTVKEPLENALNMGMELDLFRYETNAFKYYDDIIATANNGANVKDKVSNFESGKEYGIYIYLNASQTDLEKNAKANATYKRYQNKHKATKK